MSVGNMCKFGFENLFLIRIFSSFILFLYIIHLYRIITHYFRIYMTETKIFKAKWENLPGDQCGYSKGSKYGNLAIL